MSKFKLTLSLRDWRKGSELLEKLGFHDNLQMSDSHELDLEDWQKEDLEDELNSLDLEFELEELED